MKRTIKNFDSFKVNEAKVTLKNPKKVFSESKPRSMTKEQIFEDICNVADGASFSVDKNALMLALEDDKLCQKWVDAHFEIIDDIMEDTEIFDDLTDKEEKYFEEFRKNKSLKNVFSSEEDEDNEDY